MTDTIIYYDSKTGNVARFVEKVNRERQSWHAVPVTGKFQGQGHLVTYSAGDGHIPHLSFDFLELHAEGILTVSVSGNRNWGLRFGAAAYRINERYGIEIGLLFELSGFDQDVENFIGLIESKT